ncbi:hypothetical protein ACPCHT_37970 [Nucisporomicrobium flavum]|uniref:hypothetical protein n=1 Tax=Nucisporomicrobium flavum TaxID=2785915 RepID=UPI003C2B6777
MGHVLARLTGFGMVLLPHWPYAFERERDGSDAVRVTRWTAAGVEQAVIEPSRHPGGGDVVDVADGPDTPFWRVETSVFRVRWPLGLTLESPQDASDGTPFYLQGPGQATIFPQGPVARARLADPDALVAPGQRVLRRHTDDVGVTVVELGYEHDGEPWWQAHWTIPYGDDQYLVMTAQSPAAEAEQTREAAVTVVESVDGPG